MLIHSLNSRLRYTAVPIEYRSDEMRCRHMWREENLVSSGRIALIQGLTIRYVNVLKTRGYLNVLKSGSPWK
jgi:hypothetical protein